MKYLMLCILGLGSFANARVVGLVEKEPTESTRFALVIGNAAYESHPLKNPVKDAKLVASALLECGFRVLQVHDCTGEAMRASIRDFSKSIEGAEAAFFFYSGHGIEIQGNSFMVPVDGRTNDVSAVKFNCVPLALVFETMASATPPCSFIAIDMNRDNPFPETSEMLSPSNSFSKLGHHSNDGNAPTRKGAALVYSCAPGRTCMDGQDEGSPFSQSLAKGLKMKGKNAVEVLLYVIAETQQQMEYRQTPWLHLCPMPEFYFKPETTTR